MVNKHALKIRECPWSLIKINLKIISLYNKTVLKYKYDRIHILKNSATYTKNTP